MNPSSLDKINFLNILGMALAAGLALRFPFELFLFSYAVLGPLHYLTEISWLKDKGYYTKGQADSYFLMALSLLITVFYLGWIPPGPKGASEALECLAFLGALLFALSKKPVLRLALVPAAAVLVFFFSGSNWFGIFFGIFLATLVHVFVFTGLFLLAGALKSRSFSGIFSFVFFLGITAGFFFWNPSSLYHAGSYARESYGTLSPEGAASGFIAVNYELARLFHLTLPQAGPGLAGQINDFLYGNPRALGLMAFIAFAYTYHYFNWFSKTSVIRWHEIPKKRAGIVLTVWFFSLGLYAYSYNLGLRWLFFLSLTHVLLEFPLDHLTFLQVGKELRGLFQAKNKNHIQPPKGIPRSQIL